MDEDEFQRSLERAISSVRRKRWEPRICTCSWYYGVPHTINNSKTWRWHIERQRAIDGGAYDAQPEPDPEEEPEHENEVGELLIEDGVEFDAQGMNDLMVARLRNEVLENEVQNSSSEDDSDADRAYLAEILQEIGEPDEWLDQGDGEHIGDLQEGFLDEDILDADQLERDRQVIDEGVQDPIGNEDDFEYSSPSGMESVAVGSLFLSERC